MLMVKSREEGSSPGGRAVPGNPRQPGEGSSRDGEETCAGGQRAWRSLKGSASPV